MAGVAIPPFDVELHHDRRLLLVRSGEAVRRREWNGPEEARPLSIKGRKQVARLARFLAGSDLGVTTIVTGRSQRDRQTAELLAASLERPAVVDARVEPGLTPSRLEVVLDDSTVGQPDAPGRQHAVLVTSEPLASKLLVLLTDSLGVDLAPGAAASLRLQGPVGHGCAALRWLVTPSALRGLRLKGGAVAAASGDRPGAIATPAA